MPAFDEIKALFERICAQNDEPRPHPGAEREQVVAQLVAADLPPHPLLLDVYSWHNGIDNLNAFLHFFPIEEAIRVYRMHRRHDATWRKSALPIFTDNGDILFSLDTSTDEFLLDDIVNGKRWLLASHYQDYLAALRDAFEGGVAQFDADGGAFEIGEDAWTAIARRHRVSDW
jgi:hypothetical protein